MTEPENPPPDTVAPIQKSLDTKTVELLALTVFRTLFRDGVHVPLKMKGAMDLDLVIKDNNILVNMNQVQADIPELSIWRITFAYRGKPIVEYGRGIKNDVKLHIPQLCFLLLAMWQEKRKKNKAKARGEVAREREMISMSVTDPNTGATKETRG
jgi:hypothetical protein